MNSTIWCTATHRQRAQARHSASVPALTLVVWTALLLSGCAKGPAPQLYMVDLPFSAKMAGIEQGIAVGIGPIEFPQYLERPQIITRTNVVNLNASEAHMWAEPIKDSASRVLVVTLAQELNSNRIYVLPRRVRTALDWRVTVDVGRFDGSVNDKVVLAVRWSLFRGDDKGATVTRVSIVEEAISEDSYEALVLAQTQALKRFGKEIAASIRARDKN